MSLDHLGHRRGAYALGYVDDLRDPLAVLWPDAGEVGFGAPAAPADQEG